MKRNLFYVMVFALIIFVVSGCSGEKGDKPAEKSEEKRSDVKQQGVDVAKEILETFDKLVAETLELVKPKPKVAELKPKVESLFQKYESLMKNLNKKYLDLKNIDVEAWGAANSYLGENRGKHVINKNMILDEYIVYYTSQEGGQEIVQLISKDIINVLETAVKQ